MPRRVRRPLALLVAPALLIPALAACGSDDADSGAGLEAVEVTGAVGEPPQVTWGDDFSATVDPEVETVVAGDGPELAADGDALVHYWIGNGYDESEALSTYTSLPEVVDLADEQLTEVFSTALEGATVGSRIAASVVAEEVVGPSGNSQLGISNADPLLLVFDVLGPDSVDEPYAEKGTGFAPDLVLDEDGKPESMRFKDRPRPTGRLQVQVVVEGDGEVVKKSDVVMVDYLGSVYAKPKPFDGSYDGDPLVQSLSGLVPGWQEALAGKTVGSRVWMALPPRFGYGASGNEGAGIKGTDTIYFLVDILARAPKPVQPEPEETEEPEAPEQPQQPQQSGSSQPSPSADASESPSDDES